MNVQSYTILHYGADYVGYALRSVYDFMDRLHVVYTSHPSHGYRTQVTCPESRDDLRAAVLDHDPLRKIVWHEVDHIWQEGVHRDTAVNLCQAHGAELVLVLDCDEVWPADTLASVLSHVQDQDCARDWLLNFTSLWRSFGWVTRDNLWPVRLRDLRHADGVAYVPKELGPVYHFGYAVRDEIMRYKWEIHGHKSELRPGWFEEKWGAWPPPEDCHPTNDSGFWMPETFDKALLPELMQGHPFWGAERID